ncbi:phospholipase A2 inhibitor and Ly6/PLAUR domain-containing protein-like [Dunckerocampus dactyliophorus]|uniref:phospholipase A2 inhibitor and Ly6/PLAUR domain-containing protein-like n=1 Tax=Dunckerocampus dactyliophorus TaxID=161453 RepID=UPI00240562F6|nr:phospholipase A2 inhibitor and Ly6/PLAUR domain-containing protein-like [Dunckerocampus dactyliophorus]
MMLLSFMLLLLQMFWSAGKKRLGFQLLVLGFFCLAVVQGAGTPLSCLECPVGPLTAVCDFSKCSSDSSTHSCYISLGATSGNDLIKRGCIEKEKCTKIEDVSHDNQNVPMMTMCCDTDNCNNVGLFKVDTKCAA